ncbi:MAG: hypothetical protein DI539_01925 [Flavobacterium psychrophilum]|nr:MAG: hypothetical protein DI539_01925 [Flavobacterium psychrophilum]
MQIRDINKIYDYVFALPLLVLPFGKALPNIALALVVICFLADCRKLEYKRLLSFPIVVIYVFLIYIYAKGALTGSLFSEWSVYKKLIVLFIIPILFLKVKNLNILKAGVVAGAVTMAFYTFIMASVYYYYNGNLPFNTGDVVNKLMLLERPYAGFYALIGSIFSFVLIRHYTKYKVKFIICAIVCMFFIVLISARISFLTLLVTCFIYLLFYTAIPTYKKVLFFLGSLFMLTIILVFNRNISDRFFITGDIEKSLELASNFEPRVIIWPCCYEMTAKKDFNPVFGFSSYSIIENYLVSCYDSKISRPDKKVYYMESKFNSHNQFIDIYLNYGLTGLLIFLTFLAGIFYYIKDNFIFLAVFIGVVFFMMVENILQRQMGCYIFGTFTGLLSLGKLYDLRNYKFTD